VESEEQQECRRAIRCHESPSRNDAVSRMMPAQGTMANGRNHEPSSQGKHGLFPSLRAANILAQAEDLVVFNGRMRW